MSSKLTLDIGGLTNTKNLLWTLKQGYVYQLPDYTVISIEELVETSNCTPGTVLHPDVLNLPFFTTFKAVSQAIVCSGC